MADAIQDAIARIMADRVNGDPVVRFSLDYDFLPGVDTWEGWSVEINGEYLVAFQSDPVVALNKAYEKWEENQDEALCAWAETVDSPV